MNVNLREHVQRIGFDLSLGRSHIAALVYLEELRKVKWRGDLVRTPSGGRMTDPPIKRAFANIVTGFHGLEARGLLIHTDGHKTAIKTDSSGGLMLIQHSPKTWHITPAGRAVIVLLKEAGLYQEFSEQLERKEIAA